MPRGNRRTGKSGRFFQFNRKISGRFQLKSPSFPDSTEKFSGGSGSSNFELQIVPAKQNKNGTNIRHPMFVPFLFCFAGTNGYRLGYGKTMHCNESPPPYKRRNISNISKYILGNSYIKQKDLTTNPCC